MFRKRIKTKYNYFNRIRPAIYPFYDIEIRDWRDKYYCTLKQRYLIDDWFDDIYECGCCKCCGCDCDEDDYEEYEFWDVEEEI